MSRLVRAVGIGGVAAFVGALAVAVAVYTIAEAGAHWALGIKPRSPYDRTKAL